MQVAATLTNLGNAYGGLGDLERKRELLERALTITERAYGSSHHEVRAMGCSAVHEFKEGVGSMMVPAHLYQSV